MRFLEFGQETKKIIMLIHGMQMPWQMMMPQIEYFKEDYFVIVPILHGHDTEEKSTFLSIEQTAKEIEDYCIDTKKPLIHAVCGVSMGGAIATALWENTTLIIEKLLLDGAPLVPQNNLLTSIITKNYLKLTHKTQKRDNKTLEMCEKNYMPKQFMPDFIKIIDIMNDETIINCCESVGHMKLNTHLQTTNMQIVYYHGTTINEMLSKKSSKLIKKFYPEIKIYSLKGYGHCEMVFLRNQEFTQKIKNLLYNNE